MALYCSQLLTPAAVMQTPKHSTIESVIAEAVCETRRRFQRFFVGTYHDFLEGFHSEFSPAPAQRGKQKGCHSFWQPGLQGSPRFEAAEGNALVRDLKVVKKWS